MQMFIIAFLSLLALLPTPTGATVDVASLPPTCFIDAQPRTIIEGAPVRLSWRTEHATDVSISNIGPVSPNDFSIRYPSYGQASYVLTAVGEGGVATCSVLVIVTNSITATESATIQTWFTTWFIIPVVNTWLYVSEPVVQLFVGFVEEEEYFENEDSLVPSRGVFNGNLFFEEVIFERKGRSGFGENEMLKEIPWWQRIYDRVTDRYEETEEYYTSLLGNDSDIDEEYTNETKNWKNTLEEIYEEVDEDDEEETSLLKDGDSAFYRDNVSESDVANKFNSFLHNEEEEDEYVPPKKDEPIYIDEVEIYE